MPNFTVTVLAMAAASSLSAQSPDDWMPKSLADGSAPPANWQAIPAEGERLWLVGRCGRNATVATELVRGLDDLWEQLRPPYKDSARLGVIDPARPQRVLLQAVRRACPSAATVVIQFTQPARKEWRIGPDGALPPTNLNALVKGSKVYGTVLLSLADLSAFVEARTPARVDPDEAATGVAGVAVRPEGTAQSPMTDGMAFEASFASAWALPGAAQEQISLARNRELLDQAVQSLQRAERAYPSDPKAVEQGFRALSAIMDRAMKANDRELARQAADLTGAALQQAHPNLGSDATNGSLEQSAARQAWCQALAVGRWTEMLDLSTFRANLLNLASLQGENAFPCSAQAAFTLGQIALAEGNALEASGWFARSPSPVARFIEGSLILRNAIPGSPRDAYDRFAMGSAYAPAAINAASMVLARQISGGWSDETALKTLFDIGRMPGGPERKTAAQLYWQYQHRAPAQRDHTAEFVARFFAFSAAVEKFCEGRRCGSPEWLDRQRSEAVARDNARRREEDARRVDAGFEAMGGNPGALFACC